MDLNEYYNALYNGGGRPIASQPIQRGEDILSTLYNIFGTMPQGDGVRTFNPIPSKEQIENVINRFIPQDGVKRFSFPEPNDDHIMNLLHKHSLKR